MVLTSDAGLCWRQVYQKRLGRGECLLEERFIIGQNFYVALRVLCGSKKRSAGMAYPLYVHSVIANSDDTAWPVQGQGVNECGCTVAANALNLLAQRREYDKDQFVREAGLLFQRPLGGSPSPVTGWLIRRSGRGTHFGNLSHTDAEIVLRDLIDRKVPVVVEIGANRVGPFEVYGQHSILLVGYSDPYRDSRGGLREEYYFVDSQWPGLGTFDLHTNDVVENSAMTPFPGNRTMLRDEFLRMYPMRIYFPVFPSQAEHDAWYQANIRPEGGIPLVNWVGSSLLTGTYDIWIGHRTPAPAPTP
jgi:hypothetical protein